MKYGKTYEDALATQRFDKWRDSSLRYKALKKVISRLTDELSSIGLDAAVLRELLDESKGLKADLKMPREDDELLGSHKRVHMNGSTVKARAEYQLQGTPEDPVPRIKLVFDSTASDSDSEAHAHLLGGLQIHRDDLSDASSPSDLSGRFEDLSDNEAGPVDPHAPGPSIHPLLSKLYGRGVVPIDEVSPPGSPISMRSSPASSSSSKTPRQQEKEKEQDFEYLQLPDPSLTPTLDRKGWLDQVKKEDSASEEPSTDDGDIADDETPAGGPPAANASLLPPTPKRKKKRRHSRVVYIPLKSDTEFYQLLAKALHSLHELEEQQKVEFAQQVQDLARAISRVASPAKSKVDMYCWREIFSLWVEAQIFESSRERDRGERSLEQAEQRLHWFVDQVGRRKLAAKMKAKESRQALEEFLDLNMTLLDLKRFIRMNEEAARKILKKHDKRTALTGSSNFPQFLQHLKSPEAAEAQALVKPDLSLPDSHTLPHVLLATITEILLPIVPQIDDYTCLICGDISYKPIRLDCGHHFCLRCLVKMQTRKQDACPQCRSAVVLKADAHNLDNALEQFLELYFPKEVKEKAKSNDKEATQERWEVAIAQGGMHRPEDKCAIC